MIQRKQTMSFCTTSSAEQSKLEASIYKRLKMSNMLPNYYMKR